MESRAAPHARRGRPIGGERRSNGRRPSSLSSPARRQRGRRIAQARYAPAAAAAQWGAKTVGGRSLGGGQ